MPQPANLKKAELREIKWPKGEPAQENKKKVVEVQFNPQTLTVRFSNQVTGTEQIGGAARQFVGKGSTTLSLDLWFDVTAPSAKGSVQSKDDVRQLTKEVIYFIKPEERIVDGEKGLLPPGVRFVWGTFLFEGFVDSLSEALEFFSADGKPLRSKISLSITQQEIQYRFNEGGAGLGSGLGFGAGLGLSAGIGISGGVGLGAGVSLSAGASIGMAGTQPLVQAQAGVSIQGMAGSSGQTGNWKNIALANNIENPRQIEAGTLINTNVSGSIKVE
jgi:hypothetical protein